VGDPALIVMVTLPDHPLLDAHLLEARWPGPLGSLAAPAWLDALCGLASPASGPEGASAVPLPAPTPADVTAVRDLLRVGGFKPAGRNKPCNEYIRRVAEDGRFPRIDPAVDLTNAAALHGGLPVSTIDLDRAQGPLRIEIAAAGTAMVFNASGQTLDLGGLVCLFDQGGPCADAVKDSQRTKTTAETVRTLTVIWGTAALPGRAKALADWMAERMAALGAVVTH
jgi:DNA/RNA-binding domain of Phe-tRNA-synthetase-like protein